MVDGGGGVKIFEGWSGGDYCGIFRDMMLAPQGPLPATILPRLQPTNSFSNCITNPLRQFKFSHTPAPTPPTKVVSHKSPLEYRSSSIEAFTNLIYQSLKTRRKSTRLPDIFPATKLSKNVHTPFFHLIFNYLSHICIYTMILSIFES